MAKPLSPCKDCEKRQVGCHSECEEFLKFRKRLGAYKSTLKDSLHRNNLYEEYQIHKNERVKK